MNPLHIKEQKKAPGITMDREQRIYEISGRSFPENTVEFYQPLMDWLEEYAKAPDDSMELAFRYSYFNSSTLKIIFNILRLLQIAQKNGCAVSVLWEYAAEDAELRSQGEDFSDVTGIPFKFVEAPE